MGMEVLGCDGLGTIPSLNCPCGGGSLPTLKSSVSHSGGESIYIGEIQMFGPSSLFQVHKDPFSQKISQPPPPEGVCQGLNQGMLGRED
jgi:hypothetical protein